MTRSLLSDPPFLPAKLHYDERGSELFEEICQQPEYGLTRTEISIMRTHAGEIASAVGPGAAVIEPGSGASLKTELLIDALDDCAGYIPSDISDTMLSLASSRFAERFPGLPIQPVHADFMKPIKLPDEARLGSRRVVYFPGSTIGNFGDAAQHHVLKSFHSLAGEDGLLLVGFDLVKSVTAMERAYNDAAGVTAAFNLNMIHRLRSEFGLDIRPEDFEFHATWNPDRQAIVSHVHALREVTIELGKGRITLACGDGIQTEESHKYTAERIEALASSCGLAVRDQWRDDNTQFAVVLLSGG
ncbi:MAG: L-histidine N(alpha)-methyltransferase [Planctomycetota bacterium]